MTSYIFIEFPVDSTLILPPTGRWADVFRVDENGWANMVGSAHLRDDRGEESSAHLELLRASKARFSMAAGIFKNLHLPTTMVGMATSQGGTVIDRVEIRTFHKVLTPAKDFFRIADKVFDWNGTCDCGAIHTPFPTHHSDWCKWHNY
jgi:hypothetical protein